MKVLRTIFRMKYLILSSNYNFFLKDTFNMDFDYSELELPRQLVERLKRWHQEYFPIISMDENERLNSYANILQLDIEGVDLAEEIKSTLRTIKIKYYSEGQLKYIE